MSRRCERPSALETWWFLSKELVRRFVRWLIDEPYEADEEEYVTPKKQLKLSNVPDRGMSEDECIMCFRKDEPIELVYTSRVSNTRRIEVKYGRPEKIPVCPYCWVDYGLRKYPNQSWDVQ